ncbi:MAG: hypothetical protein M0P61_00430 [Ignavibacteriaceae bacterium]|nr:hypothetical protein [Ignavibacteriaceae bacterium]
MGVILEAKMDSSIREKISFTIDEKTFEFFAEATAIESRQIRNEMAELLGGIENLLSLENLISREYSAYYDKLDKLPGSKEAEEKKDEVFDAMIKDQKFYLKLLSVINEKKNLQQLAFLKVMCIKPYGYDFYSQKEEYLRKIVVELDKKLDEVKKKLPGLEA